MTPYRFVIVRRASGRFGWIFVRNDDPGRVLARSERSYRSRKRVRRAICALEGAPVVDSTKTGYLPFPLPATSFRVVRGVVPLIVDESPVEDTDTVYTVSAIAAKAGEGDDDEGEAAAAGQPARRKGK